MPADAEPFRVLITGSASGIGRCFAEHYLQQPNTTVIAVDRNPIHLTSSLSNSSTPTPNLHTHAVDFSSTPAIEFLVRDLAQQHPHIDLVIHSAGIRGLVPAIEARVPERVEAAETLESMDADTMLRTFQINTLGTFTLLQGLVGCGLLHGSAMRQRPSKVIVMTSRMGSVSYNTAGGAYAYRASKAALNAVVKSLSIDVARMEMEGDGGAKTIFALMHPGRVETGLTRCREEGAIDVEESVADMLKIIEALVGKDSGRFVDRFGQDIGW